MQALKHRSQRSVADDTNLGSLRLTSGGLVQLCARANKRHPHFTCAHPGCNADLALLSLSQAAYGIALQGADGVLAQADVERILAQLAEVEAQRVLIEVRAEG